MLPKVYVIAIIAVTSCRSYGYKPKSFNFEPARHFKRHYQFVPTREQESSQENQYSDELKNYANFYSAHNFVHQPVQASYQGLQKAQDEHVAPVYQYVQEEDPAPTHAALPASRYQSLQSSSPSLPDYTQFSGHISQSFDSQIKKAQYPQSLKLQSYEQHTQINDAPLYESHSAEVQTHDSHDKHVDYHAYPKYQFQYKVDDPHSGDNKFQHEYRDGDVVKGVYTVQEPDGSVRIVEYSADDKHGFNAIVKHTAPGQPVMLEKHEES